MFYVEYGRTDIEETEMYKLTWPFHLAVVFRPCFDRITVTENKIQIVLEMQLQKIVCEEVYINI